MTRWERHDGAVRWLEFLDGVPAAEPPPAWLEDRLCWLDERCPGWGEILLVAPILGLVCWMLAAALP